MPSINELLFIGKGLNKVRITAVYDGLRHVGSNVIYRVKVASGDIYGTVKTGSGWVAIN